MDSCKGVLSITFPCPCHASHLSPSLFLFSYTITLNHCTQLVHIPCPLHLSDFIHFYLHYMHSLMHHSFTFLAHAVHNESTCTYDSFMHHSTSFSFIYHVHNHSCSLLAFIATTPLHFTTHALHHYFTFTFESLLTPPSIPPRRVLSL